MVSHFLQDHLDSCRYSLVLCQNAGCKERMRQGSMEQHMIDCKFTPTSCEWCQKMVPLPDKEARYLIILFIIDAYIIITFIFFWLGPLAYLPGDYSSMSQLLWCQVSQERGILKYRHLGTFTHFYKFIGSNICSSLIILTQSVHFKPGSAPTNPMGVPTL